MENSISFTPRILTPFNYPDWRVDIKIVLHNQGMYRVRKGKEVEPQQALEKLKYLKMSDEYFFYVYSYHQVVSLPS